MPQTDEQPLIITLATKNRNKVTELEHYLATDVSGIRLAINPAAPDVAETGESFTENAALKAMAAEPIIPGGLVLAEDSGVIVEALAGQYGIGAFPGIYSKRWMTSEIRAELLQDTRQGPVDAADLNRGILALMKNQPDRRARYVCGMVLYRPGYGIVYQVEGETALMVTEAPAGQGGFGYDPIMRALESETPTRTMAEISAGEKNRISHRGKAFRQVLDYLLNPHNR